MHALIAFAIGPIGRYVVLGGILIAIIGGTYLKIQSDIRAKDEAARQRAAQTRIIEMEQRNDAFRRLETRDRCLAFRRDSGLPASKCD